MLGVTQGATQGIGSAMNLPMDPKGFAEHLSKNTLRETVRMGVDAAQGKIRFIPKKVRKQTEELSKH